MSRVRGWLVFCASLTLAVGCTPTAGDADPTAPEPPGASQSRSSSTSDAFWNLPLVSRNARLLGLDRVNFESAGPDSAFVSWRIPAFDPGVSKAQVAVAWRDFEVGSEIAEISRRAGLMPLWLSEPVEVREAPGVLVFGADVVDLDRVLRDARVARKHVKGAFPDWDGWLVVEVPSTPDLLEGALNGKSGDFDGVAAVTSSSDGSRNDDSPIHVFVNAGVYDAMAPAAARIVMTHEVVHVATKSPTVAVPLWWAEGLADFVAFSTVDPRDAPEARQLLRRSQRQVAALIAVHGVPEGLPTDDDFAGDGSGEGEDPGPAYESARLACQILAEMAGDLDGGQSALLELQQRLAEGVSETRAIPRTFGISYPEFVAEWRRRLVAGG